MPSTSFEVLFCHSLATKTRATEIWIKTPEISSHCCSLASSCCCSFSVLQQPLLRAASGNGGAMRERGVEIGLRKLMLDFNGGWSLQSAVRYSSCARAGTGEHRSLWQGRDALTASLRQGGVPASRTSSFPALWARIFAFVLWLCTCAKFMPVCKSFASMLIKSFA